MKRTVFAKVHVRIRPSQDVLVGLVVLLIQLAARRRASLPVGHGREVRPLQIGLTLGLPGLFGNQVIV